MTDAAFAQPSKPRRPVTRSVAIAAVAATGLAVQIGWLLVLAQATVLVGRWLLGAD